MKIMLIVKLILVVMVLWVLPYLAGNGFCEWIKTEKTVAKVYVLGLVSIWAFCQLITVPLVLVRVSFLVIVALMTAWILALSVYGIYKNKFPKLKFRDKKSSEKAVILVTGVLIVIFFAVRTYAQHTDADDSRFVVNAVDIVRTNRMYLTDPTTGSELPVWVGELCKDVTAPWAVFIAYIAKVTGVSVAIMAHTFLPICLFTAIFCVWWMLSEEFFGKDIVNRCIFIDVLMFLHLYGYYSRHSVESIMMLRIWQGKAVVCSFGIPAVMLLCMWIYRKKQKCDYLCLCLLNIAMCLMSGMGVIIGALLLGCFGLVYGIGKKSWRLTLAFWLMVIPNVIYYGINHFISL